MKKLAVIFFSILLIPLVLPSCSLQPEIDCRRLLQVLTETESSLPAGRYYSLSAAEGEDEYTSPSLLKALYGSRALSIAKEGWVDCALYISFTENPCEFAVIYCKNRDFANDTAKILCSRLSLIKASVAEKYSKTADEAKVSVIGNYVFLVISQDTEAAVKALKKAIRTS